MAVRTFEGWDDPPPGFMEADLVAHSGPVVRGSFVQTLTVTNIATGWTECAPVLVREQSLLTDVLCEIRKLLPFSLLGFDTDNDIQRRNWRRDVGLNGCHLDKLCDEWRSVKAGVLIDNLKIYDGKRIHIQFLLPSKTLIEKA